MTLDRDTQQLLRTLAPQVLGAVTRRFRDFSAAEDAVQEALIAAANQWPQSGLPNNPRGWLIHVAVRRLTDAVRANAARRSREELVVSLVPVEDQLALQAAEASDDSLELVLLCCHPTLSPASAIALTLRAVGGLTTAEIATAFLVPEATMAQRISRAKATIAASQVGFALPTVDELPARLASAMHVLYLIFNEGYTASAGDVLHRIDLSNEAIRLARLLLHLVPHDSEARALLALMLLTDARRAARTGPAGELIPLDEQDRTRWNTAQIAEGVALVTQIFSAPRAIGAYALQAAIAAIHDEAATVDATDWTEIHALYTALCQLDDSPMIRLNLAVANAMVHGPATGLADLVALAADPRLRGHHRLFAVRAHLHERAGDAASAIADYVKAAGLTSSTPERDYLQLRAARLQEASSSASGA